MTEFFPTSIFRTMADPINTADITPETLDAMVGDGRAVLEKIMRGQWDIEVEGKSIGSINTGHLTGESIVSVGGRELGRFTSH